MIVDAVHRIIAEHTYECVLISCMLLYYILLYIGVYCYDHREEICYKFMCFAQWCNRAIKKTKDYTIVHIMRAKNLWREWSTGKNLHALLKNIVYLFIFSWLVWAFEINWKDWYMDHIGKYFDFSDLLANILLTLYIIGIWFLALIRDRYKRSINGKLIFYVAFIIGVLYIRYRFFVHIFTFKPLSFVNSPVAYVDIVVIILAIYAIILICQERNRKSYLNSTFIIQQAYFYYDAPVSELDDDTLGFNNQAIDIAKEIGTLTRDHSWSVGIVGKWGSGKTSFMNLIKKQLEQTGKHLIVEFNPRMASKPQKIQEMALDCLEEAIRPYNTNLRSLMRKYMFALQLEGASGWVQVALSWLKSAYGVERAKDELNKALGELPKQVIFIFDDFDRLTKEEIVEVLKLIDGNANFNNIIYLAAYDHEQVGRLLNSATYLEKYFGIEIHVPLVKKTSLVNYLGRELQQIIPNKPKDDKLSRSVNDVLARYRVLFNRIISTLRDAKHYINIVKADKLMIYSADLNTEDFMLLELLKYHNISLYEALWKEPERYVSYKDNICMFGTQEIYSGFNESDKDFISFLFPNDSSANDGPDKIRKRDNFESYFIKPNQPRGAVRLNEIYSSAVNENRLRTILDNACNNESVLKNLCDSIEQFGRRYIDNETSMMRYLYIILYLNTKVGENYAIPETRLICRNSFYATVVEQRHIGLNPKPMGNYILNYYCDKQWTPGDISFLSGVVPDLYRGDTDNDYVFTYQEIAPIISKGFAKMGETYLQSKSEENFKSLISVFYLCVDYIEEDTTRIILDVDASRKMHDIILQAPATYINYFVRLGGESTAADVNYIACEPFWKQIFGSAEAIEEFMAKLKDSDYPRLVRMRNFWQLFKANGYQMIRFAHQGNVQEIINNDLVEQVNQLEVLNKLLSQVKQIRFNDNRAERFKDASEIKKQANKIPLEVKIKYEILQETKLYIPRAG